MIGGIGSFELLIIGVVALIVVGPKDLPLMFRQFGQFVARMRSMARDFHRAMDSAADESGFSDVKNTLHQTANFKDCGLESIQSAVDGIDSNLHVDSKNRPNSAVDKNAKIAPPRQTQKIPSETVKFKKVD